MFSNQLTVTVIHPEAAFVFSVCLFVCLFVLVLKKVNFSLQEVDMKMLLCLTGVSGPCCRWRP